jgi:chloride channel protein, CIC family
MPDHQENQVRADGAEAKPKKVLKPVPAADRVGKVLRFHIRTFARPAQRMATDRIAVNWRAFVGERQLLVWGLALVSGILVAYAAIGFRLLIGVLQLPWLHTTSERVAQAANLVPWWQILLAPTLAGLAVGLCLHYLMPGRRGHSVADVIETQALRDGRVDTKTGLLSAAMAAVSLGGGASAGREGPVVHLGATIVSWLDSKFQLPSSARRTLLGAGVAAAISASFNAPIAGVLFAHEVILAHYALRSVVPIVFASVTAAIIGHLHLGNFPAFILPAVQIVSYWEFPAFVLLGVMCACVAILFQAAIMMSEHVIWRFEMPIWQRTALGGAAVGAIGIFFPEILGVGYEATDKALSQQFSLQLLLTLIVVKTIATAITLSCRFVGGLFSPSLYLGAMTGAAFGLIATSLVPEASSSNSLYAILGMGGVAAAVLGAPFSTTMIVFELTGGFNMSIALLATISVAFGLTHACLGQSFFHWQLNKRGLFLQGGSHRAILRRVRVNDFMITLKEDSDDNRRLEKLQDPSLRPTDTLEHTLRLFDRIGATTIPVVSLSDPMEIVAHADRMTAIRTYNKALIETSVEEHR